MPDRPRILGTSPVRKEGRAKVTGRAQYVDDITLPGMWYGATVRSTIPRGRITSINFDPSIPWQEFTIVSAADILGENTIVHLTKDHPCLAVTHINHAEEPILLLAHPNRSLLPAAVAAVHITYEELPAIYTIEDSEKKEHIIWSEGEQANTFKTYLMQKNQAPIPDEVWQTADYIVEGEYRTGAQEQLYIENNGVIASYDPQHGITVWGSLQCPYYVHKALMSLFAFSADKVRVVQMETGGAFGGKEEYPSIIAAH